jgi:hypothetical protein
LLYNAIIALVQWLHYNGRRNFSTRNERPAIRANDAKITVYFNDDPPPHFHIRATSGEAKFRIDTLECIVGEIDR